MKKILLLAFTLFVCLSTVSCEREHDFYDVTVKQICSDFCTTYC